MIQENRKPGPVEESINPISPWLQRAGGLSQLSVSNWQANAHSKISHSCHFLSLLPFSPLSPSFKNSTARGHFNLLPLVSILSGNWKGKCLSSVFSILYTTSYFCHSHQPDEIVCAALLSEASVVIIEPILYETIAIWNNSTRQWCPDTKTVHTDWCHHYTRTLGRSVRQHFCVCWVYY